MTAKDIPDLRTNIENFITWLNRYGELSYDHQSYYASKLGNMAKSLYYKKPLLGLAAVSPMVASEAFLPGARFLFYKKQRLPIADAHYAMGFAYLFRVSEDEAHYERSVHFLDVLVKTRCMDYERYGWGYPFNWQTRLGNVPKGTPLITTTPYAFEAFKEIYSIDRDDKWLPILRSIAEHVFYDYKDHPTGDNAAACSYSPGGHEAVINASAYRAWVLTSASKLFSEEKYWQTAERNINFVLDNQQDDGSWPYSAEGLRDFVDHYHTCFVLKALVKINMLKNVDRISDSISRGLEYYLKALFDEDGLPNPYSLAPRLTVYKKELYDYAECLNLATLTRKTYPLMARKLEVVLEDLFSRWTKRDGSFRSRKLLLGWDNVPMHRWAQSQTFRALCYLQASEAVDIAELI